MNYSNTHLSKNRSTKANTITDISGKNKTNLLKRTTLASALALVLGVSTYANAAEAAAAAAAPAAVTPAATPAAAPPVAPKASKEEKVPAAQETSVTIPGLGTSTTVGIDAHGQITVDSKPVTNVTITFGSETESKVSEKGKNATITLGTTSSETPAITFNAPVNLGSDGTITLDLTQNNSNNKKINLTFQPQSQQASGTEPSTTSSETPATAYTGNIEVKGKGATITFEGNVNGNLVASTEGANPVNYKFTGNASVNGSVETSNKSNSNGNVANVLSFDDKGTTNHIEKIDTGIATVTAVYAKADSNKERTLTIDNVKVTGNQGQNTVLISSTDSTNNGINLTQNQNGIDIRNTPDNNLQTSIPVTTALAGTLNLGDTTATSTTLSGGQGRATNFFAAKTINVTGTVINNPNSDGTAHRTRQIFLTKDLNIANDVQGNGGQVVFDFVGQNNKIQHLSIASGETTINNVATQEPTTGTGQQLYTTSLDLGTLTLKALPKDHNATQTLDIKFATNGAAENSPSQQITATLSGNIDNQGAKLTLDSGSAPYPSNVKFSNEHLVKASQLYLQLVDGTTISANGTASNIITLANNKDSLMAVSKPAAPTETSTADATPAPAATFLAENGGTNTINVNNNEVTLSNLVFKGDDKSKNIINLASLVSTLNTNAVVTNSGQTEINSKSSTLTLADAVKTIGEDAKTTIVLPSLPTNTSQNSGTLTLSKGAETSGSGSETAFIFTKTVGTSGTAATTYNLKASGAITAKEGAKNIFVLGSEGHPAPDTLALDTSKITADGQGSANSFNLVNGDANITGITNVTATNGAATVFNFNGSDKQTLSIDGHPTGNINVNLNNVNGAVLKDPTKFEPTAGETTTITFNKDNQSLKFGGANGSGDSGVAGTTDGTFRSTGKTIFNFVEGVGTATIVGNITTTPAPAAPAPAAAAPAPAAAAPAPAPAAAAATVVTATVPTATTTSAAAQPTAGSVDFNINSSNNQNQFTLNFVKDTSVSTNFPEGTIPVDNNVSYNLNQKDVRFTLNNGGADLIVPPTVKSGTFNFNADATLTNDFAPEAGHSITFNLNGNTATLVGQDIAVTNLNATSGAVVDLSKNDDEDSDTARSNFRLLTIGNDPVAGPNGSVTYGQTGLVAKDLTFKIFVNTQPEDPRLGDPEPEANNHVYSDRIVVKDGKPGNYVLVLPDENNLSVLKDVKYVKGTGTETEGNLAVATVRTGTGIGFVVPDDVVDGEVLKATINKQNTDVNGNVSANGDYVTYFLSRASNLGLDSEFQNVYTSALQLNYDTYLANFNSLNKRLGELRTYPEAEGAWARIFGGSESNDTNAGLRTTYKTLQAGYDKLTTLLGKQSHAGVAVSYGLATSKSYLQGTGANAAQLAGASSKALEFAVYNSYVPTTGLYSDTIAKLSLVHSKFDVNRVNASNTARTKNYALTLSQELGYLINLDEAQHWSLTPSYELGLGYVGKSNFSQQVGGSVHTVSKDASTVLRNKLGAVLTYNFDPTKPGSVYLGAFYEHDNFLGGKVHFDTVSNISNPSSTTKQGLRSDGRAVLNFGVNSSLSKNIGLYLDVQKSFGGKINTDFQLNSGVRVNF